MQTTRVSLPDGSFVNVDHPDGASEEDILSFAAMNYEENLKTPPEADLSAKPDTTFLGQAEATGKAIGLGLGETFLSTAEGLAELADAGTNLIGLEDLVDSGEENELVALARKGRSSLEEAIDIEDAYKTTWMTRFGQGLGSFGGFLVPGLGATKVASLLGKSTKAAQRTGLMATTPIAIGAGAGDQAQRIQAARDRGVEVSEEQEDTAIGLGGLIGLSELSPVERLLKGLPADILGKSIGKQIMPRLVNAVKSGGVEGLQEVTAKILQDLTEKQVYDPTTPVGDSLWDEFTIGGAVGGVADLVVNSFAGRRGGRDRYTQEQLEQEQKLRNDEEEYSALKAQEADNEEQIRLQEAALREEEAALKEEETKETSLDPASIQIPSTIEETPSSGIKKPRTGQAKEPLANWADYSSNLIMSRMGSAFPSNMKFAPKRLEDGSFVVVDETGRQYGTPVSDTNNAVVLSRALMQRSIDTPARNSVDLSLDTSEETYSQEDESALKRLGRYILHPNAGSYSAGAIDWAGGVNDDVEGTVYPYADKTVEEALEAGATRKQLTPSQRINAARLKKGLPKITSFTTKEARSVLGENFSYLSEVTPILEEEQGRLGPSGLDQETYTATSVEGTPVLRTVEGEIIKSRPSTAVERDAAIEAGKKPPSRVNFTNNQDAQAYAAYLNSKKAGGFILPEDLFSETELGVSELQSLLDSKNITSKLESPEIRSIASAATGIDMRPGKNSISSLSGSDMRLVYMRLRSLLPYFANPTKIPVFAPKSYTRLQYEKAREMSRKQGEVPSRKMLEEQVGEIRPKTYAQLKKDIRSVESQALRRREAEIQAESEITERVGEIPAGEALGLPAPEQVDSRPVGLTGKEAREKNVAEQLSRISKNVRQLLNNFGLKEVGLTISDTFKRAEVGEKGDVYLAGAEGTDEGVYNGAYNHILIAADNIESLARKRAKGEEISDAELEAAIADVLNHEIVHALRMADLFTREEFDLLSGIARKQKIKGTDQTYMERALELYSDRDARVIEEEAVAEVIRAGLKGDLRIGGKPKSLMKRVSELFKRLVGFKKKEGYESFDDLIRGILTGDVGARERGKIRTLRATDAALGQAQYAPVAGFASPSETPDEPFVRRTAEQQAEVDFPEEYIGTEDDVDLNEEIDVETELKNATEGGSSQVMSSRTSAARKQRAAEQGFDTSRVWFHGSTFDISEFRGNLNPESHFGAAHYFSSNAGDASRNYAGEGPDLTQRIQIRAEQIASEKDLESDDPEALSQAKEELKGPIEGAVYPVYTRREKTFDISSDGDTFLTYGSRELDPQDYLDEADGNLELAEELARQDAYSFEPEGDLVDFLYALRRDPRADAKVDELIGEIQSEASESEGISGKRLDEIMRTKEWYAEDPETGGSMNNEVYRAALESAGFDSVIHDGDIFRGMDTARGTKHLIMFNPERIRSVNAAFDPSQISSLQIMSSRVRMPDPSNPKVVQDYKKAMKGVRLTQHAKVRAEERGIGTLDIFEAMTYGKEERDPQRKEKYKMKGKKTVVVYEPVMLPNGEKGKKILTVYPSKSDVPFQTMASRTDVTLESRQTVDEDVTPAKIKNKLVNQGWKVTHESKDKGKIKSVYLTPPRARGKQVPSFAKQIRVSDHELGTTVYGEPQGKNFYNNIVIDPDLSLEDHIQAVINDDYSNDPDGFGFGYSYQEYLKNQPVPVEPELVSPEEMEFPKPRAAATQQQLKEVAEKNAKAAVDAKGKWVPRVSYRASPEAQYIAENPEQAAVAPSSLKEMYSRTRPVTMSSRTSKAVNDLTADPKEGETMGEAYIRATGESRIDYELERFRQKAINRYSRLENLYKTRKELKGLLADSSAIAAALFADRSRGVVASAIKHGVVVYENGVTKIIDFAPKGVKIDGLIGVMAPLYNSKYGSLEKIAQAYAILKRNESIKQQIAEGKMKNKELPKTDVTLEQMEADIEQYVDPKTGENIIREWYSNWQAYNEYTIKFLKDTGMLTEETAESWRNMSSYYPFYRSVEKEGGRETQGQKVFGGLTGANSLTEMKGSESKINVPLVEAITGNLSAAIDMGMKNVAQQRIVRDMVNLGLAEKLSINQPANNKVSFRVKGKTVSFNILDPLVYESMQSLNSNMMPLLQKIFTFPANFLRETITRTPSFMIANMMRDTLSAYVTSGANFTPVIDTVAGLADGLEKLEKFGVVGGYDFANDAGDINSFWAKESDKRGLKFDSRSKGFGSNILFKPFKRMWDGLGDMTTLSDAATRNKVYEDVLARTGNEAEAAFQALEVINFSRRGSSAEARFITSAIPFLNARFQGLDVFYRAFTGKYSANADKNRASIIASAITRGGMLTALTAAYYLMVSDDDQYAEQEAYIQDNYWILPTESGHPIMIPIPFEVGLLFKVVPENIMRATVENNMITGSPVNPKARRGGREIAESFERGIVSTLEINPISGIQAIGPIVESFINYDFFRGRSIVPIYLDQNGVDGLESKFGTTELARLIGESSNISPMKIDHILYGYTGTMGMYVLDLIDAGLRSEEIQGDKTKILPARNIYEFPLWKRFFGRKEGSGLKSAAYDLKKEVDKIHGSVNALIKSGRGDEVALFLRGKEHIYNLQDTTNQIGKVLADTRKRIKEIQQSDIPAEQKRERIDILEGQMNDYLEVIPKLREKANLPYRMKVFESEKTQKEG